MSNYKNIIWKVWRFICSNYFNSIQLILHAILCYVASTLNQFNSSTPIILVGLGMTFVIATKGIDLSVGALMSIAGTLSAMILLKSLLPVDHVYLRIILAIVVPILITTCFGCFNGWLINKFSIQPIIATLVLFIAGRGIASGSH